MLFDNLIKFKRDCPIVYEEIYKNHLMKEENLDTCRWRKIFLRTKMIKYCF